MHRNFTLHARSHPRVAIIVMAALTVLTLLVILGQRSNAHSSGGAQAQVAALARPSTSVDSIPADELKQFSALLAGGKLGSPIDGSARRLSDGADGAAIYAVTTTQGQLCTLILGVTGGCVSDFTAISPVAWNLYDVDYNGSGKPLVLAGIAPDGVTQVDVLSSAGTVLASAAVHGNVFAQPLASAATPPQSVTAVRVSYADGTASTVKIR
jgi:hypothetical protein